VQPGPIAKLVLREVALDTDTADGESERNMERKRVRLADGGTDGAL
jgi:hypothetical protein